VLFLLGLGAFIVRELRTENPLLNLRVLRERNLVVSCVIIFSAFAVLYTASIALPAMLQALFGYDAFRAGLVLSPGGISSITMLVIVGFLLGRGVDARYLIAAGLIVLAVANYWTAYLNLEISPWQAVAPRMVLTAGLGLIFAPINVAAYMYVSPKLRGSAIALVSLLRNEGGSFGTSMSQTIQQRRDQFHLARLNEFLDPLNPHLKSYLAETQQLFLQFTGDPVLARQMALQQLDDLRQQQASSLAYFDVFWLAAVLGICLVPLVFLMKRTVAEKNAHIAAE
jgi:DHA2 family multidrug resistance protein